MLQTFLVYLTLYIGLLLFAKCIINNNNKRINVPLYLSLLFFSTIVGMRWMVGVDYPGYYDFVVGYMGDLGIERIEFFPRIFAEYIRNNNIPFYFWFIIMPLIQFFFLTKAFIDDKKFLLDWAFFLFLALFLGFSLNGIRQAVAIFIIFYSYRYVCTRNIFKYVLFVFIASLFHRSALLCLPLYLLGRFEKILDIKIQLLIFFILLILGENLYSFVVSLFGGIADDLQYESQFEKMLDGVARSQEGSGLGIIYNCFRYFILIVYSKVLSEKYSKINFHVFYNFLFIGICMYLICKHDIYFGRLALYFSVCELVILSLYYYDSFNKISKINLQTVIASVMISGQVIIILNSIITGKNWTFIWEVGKL